MKMSGTMDHFQMKTNYMGRQGIVHNLRKYRGYFNKGTSTGSLWKGATLKPMDRFEGNFQVVATDYYNYAIIYSCTPATAMYDEEWITAVVRNPPGLEEPDQEIEDVIKKEFNRIFNPMEYAK